MEKSIFILAQAGEKSTGNGIMLALLIILVITAGYFLLRRKKK